MKVAPRDTQFWCCRQDLFALCWIKFFSVYICSIYMETLFQDLHSFSVPLEFFTPCFCFYWFRNLFATVQGIYDFLGLFLTPDVDTQEKSIAIPGIRTAWVAVRASPSATTVSRLLLILLLLLLLLFCLWFRGNAWARFNSYGHPLLN